MNIKKGCRRIGLVILAVFVAYYLFLFVVSGFIFWKIDYISQANVINLSNNQTESLIDFSQKYFEKEKNDYDYLKYDFNTLGFNIHPYKEYFINFDNVIFRNNQIYTVENANYQIKLPGKWKYLFTQFWQFLLIPLFVLVCCAAYLLVEKIVIWSKKVIIWIINGFKE